MADIEEIERKRKHDDETQGKMEEQEKIMSERKAAEIAANPYDSPFVGRATYHRVMDTGCTSCRMKERTIADLSAKNASSVRINDELTMQILKLQDEVAMMGTHARYDSFHRYL